LMFVHVGNIGCELSAVCTAAHTSPSQRWTAEIT
jgi:hypothetical protein